MKADSEKPDVALQCPVPHSKQEVIQMAHGGGGRLTQQLLEQIIRPVFNNPHLNKGHDGAVLDSRSSRLAFTTDSYVIAPLFFPGGDIGKLAVLGTLNDLAMCGAMPAHLSVSFILEEGFALSAFEKIVASMGHTLKENQVTCVTGDTKVVDRGKGDGLYINTAGVGFFAHDVTIGRDQVRPGDAIVLSGDLGRHGIAIMGHREGLEFETAIQSDCASLVQPVRALLDQGIEIHCLRDCTRGGLAGALNEIADTAGVSMTIEEEKIPVEDAVEGACEILGLDPLYVANEGRFVAFVRPEESEAVLQTLKRQSPGFQPERIGTVTRRQKYVSVTLRSTFGTDRILDLKSGEQLPRIC